MSLCIRCDKKPIIYTTKKLCKSCYSIARTKRITEQICSTPDCNRAIYIVKRQLCRRCYMFFRTTEENTSSPNCSVENCNLPRFARGYCQPHYSQFNNYGYIKHPILKFQKKREIKKMSGSSITDYGYRRIRTPEGRWMLEHRYVMEQVLGRSLYPGESVHHKDGDKLNNIPENLELWVKNQPTGVRADDLVKWAKEILRRYE